MSATEISCALAGAAALGAVLVMYSPQIAKGSLGRGGNCASAMRTTTHPKEAPRLGSRCNDNDGKSVFDAATHFDPPQLSSKSLNAVRGMQAQRRTLTEMVVQQLDASRNSRLTGFDVLSAGRCNGPRGGDLDAARDMMWMQSPFDAYAQK